MIEKYAKLTEIEIKTLVVKDKWLESIQVSIENETKRLAQGFTERVKELEERYTQTLPELEREVEVFSVKVEDHLRKMGVDWE